MKNFDVVIGSNYGDEGKGQTTDYLVSQYKKGSVAVTRFSGGANCGHTVELEDGTRHVFHHFGSGTFLGAPTILTRDVVVNPILFWQELEELSVKTDEEIKVFVDPACKVTTPYDVFLNQEIERKRGKENAHGSTGTGLNETEERHSTGIKLTVADMLNLKVLRRKLNEVEAYFKYRLKNLGLDYTDYSILEQAKKKFVKDCLDFVSNITVVYDTVVLSRYDNIVFEGSQGLMLDQKSDDFPHVTRANTGLTNIIRFIEEFDNNLNIYYISRSYLTRHGNGSMPTECEFLKPRVLDYTNIENEFQGKLRYGVLDFNRIGSVVSKDLEQLGKFPKKINAVITWWEDDNIDHLNIFRNYTRATQATRTLISCGKTRESFKIKEK